LERLRLLLVPRLTAVLILVVLLMALVSVVSNKLGIEIGLSVALFPMIIMTMTIERMSIAWEERGPAHAIREAVGSLIIASLAYLVMTWERVEHLVFVFPELLLVLFAITLLIGRYSGYRLVELFRFRALARDPIGPQPGMQAAPAAGTGG
ncbi:MAG TPA: 7TM domain-containing protein, partial [Candidatus Saccharimonadia bacterium]|nr:7TM domain-containing protein [Candidatus Saccharimonadia bacterium]